MRFPFYQCDFCGQNLVRRTFPQDCAEVTARCLAACRVLQRKVSLGCKGDADVDRTAHWSNSFDRYIAAFSGPCTRLNAYRPNALRSSGTRSVRSHVKVPSVSSGVRPKWPYAVVGT